MLSVIHESRIMEGYDMLDVNQVQEVQHLEALKAPNNVSCSNYGWVV